MYVCHCEVVSDHRIRTAISAGARNLDEVAVLCRAGSACAGCHPTIEELLAEAADALREPERVRSRQARRRLERSAPALNVPAAAG
ncbi:MAG: (2Fe-2S)-binding protein [Actinobacteria bacterium]|nr:(2Fe-2S)-binding protein [Actinomycetota bacterium]